MNILVTTICNRRCPYCFAASRVSNSAAKDSSYITLENFKRALAFGSKMEPVVGILGGEPSLHPEFASLIEQTWAAGFDAKIFTNGVWSEKAMAGVENLAGRNTRNLR